MNSNQPSNTLAIIGLVIGIIAIVFSFIPCVGTMAFIPGIIGLILGVIALLKAKDNGEPTGMSIAVIAVSVIACALSAFQIFYIGSMASDIKGEMKEYTNCEELKIDYTAVEKEMNDLTKEMESDNASFSNITKMAKLGSKIGHFQEQSDKLDCDLEFGNFDPSDGIESEEEIDNGDEGEESQGEEGGNQ